MVLRGKSNMVPLDRLTSEVIAVAKRDLEPGDVMDSIGGTTFYGLIERYDVAHAEGLLPIGLAKGAHVRSRISVDHAISYDDVDIQEPSTVGALRRLQERWMAGEIEGAYLAGALDAL
jgi:predicted homoserine dehydrogenase-like protein